MSGMRKRNARMRAAVVSMNAPLRAHEYERARFTPGP